jgi:hypothetical protein
VSDKLSAQVIQSLAILIRDQLELVRICTREWWRLLRSLQPQLALAFDRCQSVSGLSL